MNPWHTATTLRKLFAVDTAEDVWVDGIPYPPDVNNISAGHCHVAALVLFWRHGGKIMAGTAYDHGIAMRHYWNVIESITLDATRDQFASTSAFAAIEDATKEKVAGETLYKAQLLGRRLTIENRNSF